MAKRSSKDYRRTRSIKVIMSARDQELPKRKVYDLRDYTESTAAEKFDSNYAQGVPIGIDFGGSRIRAGLTSVQEPAHNYANLISKYRDRKLNKTLTYIGNDVFLDPSIKNQAKSPYDGSFITNWDYVETILDYTFNHIGVNSSGGVNNPIILTEKPAAPLLQRKNFYELLYETYNVPQVAIGIDSLFSYYQNNGVNGLVIGTGHEHTHVIPVLKGQGLLNETKRINWGGQQASNYLGSLLQLKYPYFPTKINNYQIDNLVKDYCYVSKNYEQELSTALDLDILEKTDIIAEAPFTEVIQQQKTEEELARQAEKRKESGRRLQEQAQQKRLEKLIQKEQEFEYYTNLKEKLSTLNKKLTQSTLKEEGFTGEDDFNKYIENLDKSLKKARKQDVGEDNGEDDQQPPSFPLVEIADEELNEEQIKEKRKQRLLKANYDARQRAKREKEEEKLRLLEEQKKDDEWRESNLNEWIQDRRLKLSKIFEARKERQKLKEALNDRKSHAAQIRMKNIASLASDENSTSGGGSSKRKRGAATIDKDPNDTFGANDDDWAIYRDIANVDDEEALEEEEANLVKIEKELLEYDPNFTIEDTLDAQYDWRKSITHLFLRGPRPFNSEDSHEQHQIHLNVERIRIPEVLFQPSIAGVDQAGIIEVGESILLNRLSGKGFSGDSYDALQDIFITGGQAHFQNFEERLFNEYKSFLPADSPLNVRTAQDPINDSWKGIAKWVKSGQAENAYLSKQDYEEMGADYIKEHNLGNVNVLEH
ncbi:Actin-related protein 5 [Wickerhamomyces ciferrii]|uniref:Actin-related protein 5 n=1 Tax=Wickerhamomyces ciferrii (strain ATCC 14091 / BCRC 22168 / CBS 111 / JCM 3599 / NBRC 0793 / NRRL Y-1031 F-60-10) TaxID=1206466 RepID=K0KD04_WICCF|nr:Actin-related protein 5 [Wickerhamomyces ciferrii]CCH40756.1 Actin-related protein 5 [Wickerhamomyces ciferrii]